MIEELIILTNIIFITIILTADNAVIVGSIASNFVPKNRKQIILWGVIGAFVFKIFFAIFATFLFEDFVFLILSSHFHQWSFKTFFPSMISQFMDFRTNF